MEVSAVIPCHNARQWIGEAIASLRKQAPAPQIIVVDDSSTDGSADLAREAGEDVTVIRGEWRNGNSARNAGLAMATGEWIQFLDADDFLTPGKFASQLAAADEETDVLYSPLILRNETHGTESVMRPTPSSDLVEQWLRWELCQTGAALWRTASLRRIGGWKEGLPCCQDNEVTLRALKASLRFKYVDTPGAVYRIWSEETICRKDPVRVIRGKTALIDECLAWLGGKGILNSSHLAIAGQAGFEMARTWAKSNLTAASSYYRERNKAGLLQITGPAAPDKYKLILRIFGFKAAERLAKWQRTSA